MKHIILVVLALMLTACPKEGANSDDELPSTPDVSIKDTWRYDNPDGSCAADEVFGDNPVGAKLGCLHFAQLTRFQDGSAYFTLILGNTGSGLDVTWSEYVKSAALYENELHLGSNLKYKINLNLGLSVPTLVLDFDQTLTYSDATSHAHVLTQVGI